MISAKRTLMVAALLFLPVTTVPSGVDAQSQMDLERAVMAAPANMGADATVLALNEDGSSEVLREGSNGLICWDSTHYDPRFNSMCTSEANRERVEQTHRVRQTTDSDEAASARFQELEESGDRVAPEYGTFFFRARGEDPETAARHTTISVPYATNESLELPEGRRPATLLLHQPGTSSAHLMLPRGM